MASGVRRSDRPVHSVRSGTITSSECRSLLAPVLQGRTGTRAKVASRHAEQALSGTRECQVANRHHVRPGSRLAVTRRGRRSVELFHIPTESAVCASTKARNPISKGPVSQRIEGAEWQSACGPDSSLVTRMAGSSCSTVTIAAVSPISIGVRTDSVIAPSYPDHVGPAGLHTIADQLIPARAGKVPPPSRADLGQSFRSRSSYDLPDRALDRQATRYEGWEWQLPTLDAEPAQLTTRRVAG